MAFDQIETEKAKSFFIASLNDDKFLRISERKIHITHIYRDNLIKNATHQNVQTQLIIYASIGHCFSVPNFVGKYLYFFDLSIRNFDVGILDKRSKFFLKFC